MTTGEYINELKTCLEGAVSANVIADSVRYYEGYIRDEMNSGKSEEQVLEDLGSARLIAKSIVDAQDGAARKQEEYIEEERRKAEREERERGRRLHADINEKGEFDIKYGRFSFNSWYGKLLLILAAVLIVVLIVLAIVAAVMLAWYLLPAIAVVIILIILLAIFMNIGRRQ